MADGAVRTKPAGPAATAEDGRSEGLAEALVSASRDAVVATDADGTIVLWNAAAADMFGHSAEAALGRHVDLIIPDHLRGKHRSGMRRVVEGGAPRVIGQTVELLAQRADGTVFPIEMCVCMWQGAEVHFGSIIRDVSDRRRNEERLYELAHFDQLTLLPNRANFCGRLTDLFAQDGEDAEVALLIADLDGFSEINDLQGYAVGDELLCKVATQLNRTVGAFDGDASTARLGPNQFGVILPGARDVLAAAGFADQLRSALASVAADDQRGFTVSVGLALAPLHGVTPRQLIANADFALRRAKRCGGDRRELFQPRQHQAARERRDLEIELKRAWDNGEFEIFYQPQVRLKDHAVVGAEALLRWSHPERGVLLPGAFLHAMTDSRLAELVGDYVVDQACRFAVRVGEETGTPFRIAVNLFERQLFRPDQPQRIERALGAAGLRPELLELEILETVMTGSDDASIRRVKRLRDIGVGIAFDDYGTGYASLGLLKRYPVTRLKIDRSFVRDLSANPADQTIVQLVLTLGERFGLDVIAEGVETQAQRELLMDLGCVEAQGFLLGRPKPAVDWLAASNFGVGAKIA